MSKSKMETVFHPARIKIIQLLSRQAMTVQEMHEEIPDVAQASLYRHLNVLKKNGIVRVTDEKQVRGTVEKRYAVDGQGAVLTGEEANALPKEEHLKYFMAFFSIVLQQVETYLEGEVDFEQDGFSYHQLDMKLNDDEYIAFANEYSSLLKRYHKKNTDGGRKWTISNVVVPEKRT